MFCAYSFINHGTLKSNRMGLNVSYISKYLNDIIMSNSHVYTLIKF